MTGFIIIFIAKMVEVSLSTLRVVFVSKGEKLYASTIGFIEVIIWLQVASVVLVDINLYPEKMLAYAMGFSFGSYIGLIVEEKLGLGYSNIQIITNEADGLELSNAIREMGKAVTVIKGEGRDSNKLVLSTFVKRKNKDLILNCVKALNINGVVTVSQTQKIYGGFGVS